MILNYLKCFYINLNNYYKYMEEQTIGSAQTKGGGALDAFLNLLHLITLGWVAVSLGQVLFWIISKFFSQALYYGIQSQSTLKFGIASLIIVTPVFLGVAGFLHRQYKENKLNHQSGIHRWLTYLMLLISALTVIGDLIALVFRLLDGDYAIAFLLKILVIFVIAGGVFGYNLYDLRRKDYAKRNTVSMASFIAVIAVVLVAIIGSLFMVDSPQSSRLQQIDQTRVNDLSELNSLISSYYYENKTLPANLSDTKFTRITDPQTSAPYVYAVSGPKAYQLCATFALKANVDRNQYLGNDDWYYHNAGYQCFTKKIVDDINAKPGIPVPVK